MRKISAMFHYLKTNIVRSFYSGRKINVGRLWMNWGFLHLMLCLKSRDGIKTIARLSHGFRADTSRWCYGVRHCIFFKKGVMLS